MAINLSDVGAIGFDVSNLAIDKTKEQGVWQQALRGKWELRVKPAHSKRFTRHAQNAWKKRMKAHGVERAEDLPDNIQENISVDLMPDLVTGWKTLIRKDSLEHPALAEVKPLATEVYESTGDPVPDGYVLIPYMLFRKSLLEFSPENVKLMVKESDEFNMEINTLAKNKEMYSVGGLDAMD